MASYFTVDCICKLIYTLNHWGFENLMVHEVFQTLVALGGCLEMVWPPCSKLFLNAFQL